MLGQTLLLPRVRRNQQRRRKSNGLRIQKEGSQRRQEEMSFKDDIAMGLGLKERDQDYHDRTAANISRQRGKDAGQRYLQQVAAKGTPAQGGLLSFIAGKKGYRDAKDMFDGGGPQASGGMYEGGGPLSLLANIAKLLAGKDFGERTPYSSAPSATPSSVSITQQQPKNYIGSGANPANAYVASEGVSQNPQLDIRIPASGLTYEPMPLRQPATGNTYGQSPAMDRTMMIGVLARAGLDRSHLEELPTPALQSLYSNQMSRNPRAYGRGM
jgi:hypothetical protein